MKKQIIDEQNNELKQIEILSKIILKEKKNEMPVFYTWISLFLLILFVIYLGVNDSNKEETKITKIPDSILIKPTQAENITLSVYNSQIKELKNQVSELQKKKNELDENISKKSELLLNEMKLKNEIKEIELSKANGEGFSEGYDKGMHDANMRSAGSFGAGVISGALIFGK